MEITFIFDWFSFGLGVVSTLIVGFAVIFAVALKQYRGQNKRRPKL
jgi:hypothetical protein